LLIDGGARVIIGDDEGGASFVEDPTESLRRWGIARAARTASSANQFRLVELTRRTEL
jgi:hypothetical protein